MAERLKSGDLVLFSRDCSKYYVSCNRHHQHNACLRSSDLQPCGTAVCAGNKAASGVPFDHAGVVVMWHGFPMLAEWTFGGVKVRPFDERIVCSKAPEVAVRPLATPLTPPQEDALKRAVAFTNQNAASASLKQLLGWITGSDSTIDAPSPRGTPPAASSSPPSSGESLQRELPPMPGYKPRPPDFAGDELASPDAPPSAQQEGGSLTQWRSTPNDGDSWQDLAAHTKPTLAIGASNAPPALKTLQAVASVAVGRECSPAAEYVATLYAAAGLLPGTAPLPRRQAGLEDGIRGTVAPLHGLRWDSVQRHSSMRVWGGAGLSDLPPTTAPVAFGPAVVFRDK